MNPLRLPQLNRPSDRSSAEEKDRVVQQTDQDASQSRLSAVETGYLHDPFAKLFVTDEVQTRYPLINRGDREPTLTLEKKAITADWHQEPSSAQRQLTSSWGVSCLLPRPRPSRLSPWVQAPTHGISGLPLRTPPLWRLYPTTRSTSQPLRPAK